MSTVDIHPEDLFDKLEQGDLSPAEQERFAHHLSHCEVCRFEWQARADFECEADVVLARQRSIPLLPAPTLERPAPVRPRKRALVWILAAASFAVAAGAWASFTKFRFEPAAPPSAPSAAPSALAQQSRPRHARLATAPEATATASATGAAPTPSVVNHSAHALVHRVAAAAPAASATADNPDSARSLFAAANRARKSGDTPGAVALYRSLQQQFPSSQEAALSQVTLSTLLLASDPSQALAGFDAYLARGGQPLEAEALVGRARALRGLGRSTAELAAWREVRSRYPNSVYARQAQERLDALSAP